VAVTVISGPQNLGYLVRFTARAAQKPNGVSACSPSAVALTTRPVLSMTILISIELLRPWLQAFTWVTTARSPKSS
jgi:hypothetical protein